MVVDERVRVGSLAGPLRSLESAGKPEVKRGKHRKRQYKVRAQRQPSILTKGRRMPRWYVQQGQGRLPSALSVGYMRSLDSLQQVSGSA